MATLGDRVRAVRTSTFVGRHDEIELVRTALQAAEPPFAVLLVHGPGGVGKSALLRAMAQTSAALGVPTVLLDGRSIAPTPEAFTAAAGSPRLLLVDTSEALAPLDTWLRERYVPALPADALVVLAGRERPSPGWVTDGGWQGLVQVLPLRNLPPGDSRDYLARVGVPPERRDAVLAATHGHPLALVLSADLVRRRPDASPDLIDSPDLVRVLLAQLVADVPGPRHRQALAVAAHARVTTEDLLRSVLGDGHEELFEWLRAQPFVDEAASGLHPHDLVRDVLDADLRWRDPADYAELHRRVREHAIDRIRRGRGADQQQAILDLLFVHRTSPVVRRTWEWASFGQGYAEPAEPGDRDALIDIVARHWGPDSARIARHWLVVQPGAFRVCRAAGGSVGGFFASIRLDTATAADRAVDPVAVAMWEHAERFDPPRPGEPVTAYRFFLDAVAGQAPSPTVNLVSADSVRHWLGTPGLVWDFLVTGDPPFWDGMFRYLDFHPAAEVAVGDRVFVAYGHDWRSSPLGRWLDLMAVREIDAHFTAPADPEPEPLLVLSRPEFAAAVKAALRGLGDDRALAGNPLLRTRTLVDAAARDGAAAPGPATLRAVLTSVVAELAAAPRGARPARALHRTYLHPAPSQEKAAEILGLPFSTYRRHLAHGVDRVVATLWQRELDPPG
jgi:hypothetical protein